MKKETLDLSKPKYSLPQNPRGIAVVRAHFETITKAKDIGWTWDQIFSGINSAYPGLYKKTNQLKKAYYRVKKENPTNKSHEQSPLSPTPQRPGVGQRKQSPRANPSSSQTDEETGPRKSTFQKLDLD